MTPMPRRGETRRVNQLPLAPGFAPVVGIAHGERVVIALQPARLEQDQGGIVVRLADVRAVLPGEAAVGGSVELHAVASAESAHGEQQCLIWQRSEERRVGKECRSRWSPY